ncbi:hypothetical protein CSC70_06635 [Pseudoxanthomonas kalamensis DSM 18571]|uniref:hypothetical protein n=1 Tax=Pseudoxanthomonas kalamensis TaxID=289483 RepID=UPI001390F71E|nr:hypothetical protein [Pseudoxanthomonas kalamensis]KAF1710358.1 hypothetical protein CSC70_06635 [Pseudoxanthomonas kalamensis DSM 18571]
MGKPEIPEFEIAVAKLIERVQRCADGPVLDWDIWLAIGFADLVVLLAGVAVFLKVAVPSRRLAVEGLVVMFVVVGILPTIVLYAGLETGEIQLRHGRKLRYCVDPAAFWARMAFYNVWLVGAMSGVVATVIRLRRPYRKYRKYMDLVE